MSKNDEVSIKDIEKRHKSEYYNVNPYSNSRKIEVNEDCCSCLKFN